MRRYEAANRDSPVRSLGEAEIVSADGALQGGGKRCVRLLNE